jgi:hypothetical protein
MTKVCHNVRKLGDKNGCFPLPSRRISTLFHVAFYITTHDAATLQEDTEKLDYNVMCRNSLFPSEDQQYERKERTIAALQNLF